MQAQAGIQNIYEVKGLWIAQEGGGKVVTQTSDHGRKGNASKQEGKQKNTNNNDAKSESPEARVENRMAQQEPKRKDAEVRTQEYRS